MSVLRRVLAFDLGASSGRAMLGTLEGGRISLAEVHRFSNEPVSINGTLYWDVYRLFHEIKLGISKALAIGEFESIGIDTWGVDFGLLRSDGSLVECPVHYRDARTIGIPDSVFEKIPQDELYGITGIQVMELNTVFQLYSLVRSRAHILDESETLLMMSDLFNYFLTGEKKTEYSIATTTHMIDAKTGLWSRTILDALGIPPRILTDIVPSGTTVGTLHQGLCRELACPPVKVIAVAGHDTQSAVAAVPTVATPLGIGSEFAFLSSGTWSLLGTELDEPILGGAAASLNVTNEGGFGGKITLLKNIVGLWIVQECRRQWEREGRVYSFAELCDMACSSTDAGCFIDPDDPDFTSPGNMPERVRSYCERTGQSVPGTPGEIIRCVYHSLALKYRWALEQIEACTGKRYPRLHVVSGGARDSFLCQLTAIACAREVVAGPVEATVLGNVAVQMIALGAVSSMNEARQIVAGSYPLVTYTPDDAGDRTAADRDEEYTRFLAVCGIS